MALVGFQVTLVSHDDQRNPISTLSTSQTDAQEQYRLRVGVLARWLRILSLSIRIISKDCLDATE